MRCPEAIWAVLARTEKECGCTRYHSSARSVCGVAGHRHGHVPMGCNVLRGMIWGACFPVCICVVFMQESVDVCIMCGNRGCMWAVCTTGGDARRAPYTYIPSWLRAILPRIRLSAELASSYHTKARLDHDGAGHTISVRLRGRCMACGGPCGVY